MNLDSHNWSSQAKSAKYLWLSVYVCFRICAFFLISNEKTVSTRWQISWFTISKAIPTFRLFKPKFLIKDRLVKVSQFLIHWLDISTRFHVSPFLSIFSQFSTRSPINAPSPNLGLLKLIAFDLLYFNWGHTLFTLPLPVFSRLAFVDSGNPISLVITKTLRAWQSFDLLTTFSDLLTMFITDNDPDHDSGILQMGLVVSDTDAEGNGTFNEELDSDHEGSEPTLIIDPSSNESTPQRNAVADVLMGFNDQVLFTFGSSLPNMNANHERINHLEPNPVVPRRLLQSTNIPANQYNINNTNPTGCIEIHYNMLHILSSMANLSSHLLRLSVHSDGNPLEDAHIFTSQWFQELNHFSGIILMNINNTKQLISNSDKWAGIYNRFVQNHSSCRRIPDNRTIEISDLDRIQPAIMPGDFVRHHTIYSVLSCLQQPPILIQ